MNFLVPDRRLGEKIGTKISPIPENGWYWFLKALVKHCTVDLELIRRISRITLLG